MKLLLKIFFALVALLLVCEGAIRFLILIHAPSVSGYDYALKIDNRLFSVWHTPFKRDTSPPFPKLSNRSADSLARLKEIYPFSKITPNTDIVEPDFLLPQSTENYHIHINSQGFRSPEWPNPGKKKPLKILCLGSYLTFGQGLDDEKIWPYLLERKLEGQLGRPVQVMNAGLNSGTAIMGLSRLTLDGETIRPDIIIIEYGILDGSVSDSIPENDPRFTNQESLVNLQGEELAVKFGRIAVFNQYLRNSQVAYNFYRIITANILDREFGGRYARFSFALKQILREGHKYTNHFILLAHPIAYSYAPKFFQDFAKSEGMPLVDVGEILRQHKSEFNITPSWAKEFDEDPSFFAEQLPYFKDIMGAYRNAFQLNSRSHELVADAIDKTILDHFAANKKK